MDTIILDSQGVKNLTRKLARNDLKFYQFYNIDFSADEYLFQEYKKNYKETADFSSVVLNKCYYDIEIYYDPKIFPDPEKAAYMINSIALYNNISNKAILFMIPFYTDIKTKESKRCNEIDRDVIQEQVHNLYNDLIQENETYRVDNINIEVRIFNSEIEMIKDFFLTLRNFNALFLIGFNSSLFDNPYIINRGLNLMGEEIYNYISEFGEVQKYGDRTFEWPDIITDDILVDYKPVDQGGKGQGKSLPNYKLGTVADAELGITKLDIENLNDEYKTNIARFGTYNLLDTLLTFKLDEKLQFLELNFVLSKYNQAPASSAIRGRSLMYRYRNDLLYTEQNKLIRTRMFNREIFFPFLGNDSGTQNGK